MRIIDAEPIINTLKAEYEVFAQEFEKTNVFENSRNVAVYGSLKTEVKFIIMMLENEPKVDAIPVSWIQETVQYAEKVGAKEYAEDLEVLLADWDEERKE